jgi:hypothetical protein
MTAPALSEFDVIVSALVAKGFSRELAEAEVRRQHPNIRRVEREQIEARRENVLEKEEQAFIAKLFRGFGCKVYNLSQARAAKQTPGLPDLWVVHLEAKLAFWFETKRQVGGKLSAAQLQFRDECAIAGVKHYWGDRYAAARDPARQEPRPRRRRPLRHRPVPRGAMNPKLSTIKPFDMVIATVARCSETSSAWTFLMPGEALKPECPPTDRGSYVIRSHLN